MKDVMLKVRVTSEWLAELDAWRARQEPKMSRSEAVRIAMKIVSAAALGRVQISILEGDSGIGIERHGTSYAQMGSIQMTVAELRKLLEGLPDNLPIVAYHEGEYYSTDGIQVTRYDKDGGPWTHALGDYVAIEVWGY